MRSGAIGQRRPVMWSLRASPVPTPHVNRPSKSSPVVAAATAVRFNGFYLFQAPFLHGLAGYVSAVLVIAGIAGIATAYLYGAIRITGPR